MESKTLRSHRVIGEVADGTPQTCAFYDLGGVGYCAVRVGGDAFQVMALDGLTVQSASPRLGRNIRAIGAQGEWTYCAIDDEVWCFLRARFVGLAAGAPAAVDRFELCGNQPAVRVEQTMSEGRRRASMAWRVSFQFTSAQVPGLHHVPGSEAARHAHGPREGLRHPRAIEG